MEGLQSAGFEDEKQIYKLIVELEDQQLDEKNFMKVYEANLLNPTVYYWVYKQEGHILGFISIHVHKLLHHAGNIAEIQEFIVAGSARGKGIGKKLFEKAKEIGIEEECIQLEVCCNQKRSSSHKFYESQRMTNHHYKFCLSLEH